MRNSSSINYFIDGWSFFRLWFWSYRSNRIQFLYGPRDKVFGVSAHLLANETFYTVPSIIFQLYTIYADIFSVNFPCIYILCALKNRFTEKVFFTSKQSSFGSWSINFCWTYYDGFRTKCYEFRTHCNSKCKHQRLFF